MTAIDWEHLSEKRYEDMGSVLLSHLHPASTRIDGSGGDGGRDVQIVTGDGIEVFQLKSFPGRMVPKRRAQVKKSLLKAKTLGPRSWTLIVPIDPTPKELEWFDTLHKLVDFPIEWRGRTWLDAQFATRPSIARYFLEDAANEVVRLAEILHQEQAVLAGGAPEALERAGRVVDQLNALDPFYKYELTVGEGVRKVTLAPRYQGALVDRPIESSFKFVFPNDEGGQAAAAALERALDFGTSVEVPEQYVEEFHVEGPVQLGPTFSKPSIRLDPIPGDAEKETFILAVVTPDDQTVSELPVEFERTSSGRRGSIWTGHDRTEALTVTMTADGQERRFQATLSIKAIPEYYPQDMLPLARFADVLMKPNALEIRRANGDRISELTDAPEVQWIEPHLRRLVEDLVLVQAASGVMRKVPDRVPVEEMNLIAVGAALLRGEAIEISWDHMPFTVQGDAGGLFEPDFPVTVVTHAPHTVQFGGTTYSLGKRARVTYRARLAGVVQRDGETVAVVPVPDQWVFDRTIPPGTEVMLKPATESAARISLVSETASNPE